jgi:hypothetical protein
MTKQEIIAKILSTNVDTPVAQKMKEAAKR